MFGSLILLSLIPYHLTVFTLALPTLLNLTADSIPSNANTDPQAHCPPGESIQHELPLLSDCVRAVRGLPQSDYVGYFHIGGEESFWRLPLTSSHRSCKLFVTLHQDISVDMGSWDDIRTAGAKLLLDCRLPFEIGGEQRTGGWITSGAENGIVVEMTRSNLGAVNGTGVGSGQGTNAVDAE